MAVPDIPLTKPCSTKPKTILVIEDDALQLNQLRIVLHRAGHRVLTASNVSKAEELWAMGRKSIDLVISDHFLGFDRGAELIQRFKAQEPRVRMILCSGGEALQISGVAFLEKPFGSSALLSLAA